MHRLITAFSLGAFITLVGCTSSTTSENATTPTTSDVDSTTVVDTANVETPTVTSPPAQGDEKEYDSAQAYIEAMQAAVEESAALGGRPTPDGLNTALALGAKARQEFPDDENILRAMTVLMFQSLQVEDNEQTLIERRLELGKLSRLLVERNKDDLSELGNMPSILLLEEAKGYIGKNELSNAWASLEAAHENGFDQTNLLFLDPTFESLVASEEYAPKVKAWLSEELDAQMAAQESFPFDFTLKSLTADGEEVSLSDFKGKPVVVDFWGTWCPPCRAALPHLVDLHEEHKDELVVLGINFEQRTGASSFEEAKEIVDGFLKTEPLPYPCLYGEQELTSQVPGFRGFPTMVFVDKKGEVRLSLTGYNPAPVLEAVVERLLAE